MGVGLGLCFWAYLSAGCSVATPHVKSLLSQMITFKLNVNDLRIHALSELSHVYISGSCDSSSAGFQYSQPDTAPGSWILFPSTVPSGIFTTFQNNCATSNNFSLELDLSSTTPFSTMALGTTYKLDFQVMGFGGLLAKDEFRITYSNYSLADDQFNNGQGLNDTKTSVSTNYNLQGRITNIEKLPIISGTTHTLQGQVVFQ
jgi:hypothetical protein